MVFSAGCSLCGLFAVLWWDHCAQRSDYRSGVRDDVSVVAPFCTEQEIFSFLTDQDHLRDELRSSEQIVPARSFEMPGLNPKVCAIERALTRTVREKRFLLMMDSNTAAQPFHVSAMLKAMGPDTAVVFSPIAAIRPVTRSDFVDAAMINTTVAKSMMLASALGLPVAIGKSLMIDCEKIDPEETLLLSRRVIAEDTQVAKIARALGYRTKIAPLPVAQTYRPGTGAQPAFERILRWTRIQLWSWPAVYLLMLLENAWVQAALVYFLSVRAHTGTRAAVFSALYVISLYAADAACYSTLYPAGFLPFSVWVRKQSYCLAAWVLAPCSRGVEWRGRKIRLGFGGQII